MNKYIENFTFSRTKLYIFKFSPNLKNFSHIYGSSPHISSDLHISLLGHISKWSQEIYHSPKPTLSKTWK